MPISHAHLRSFHAVARYGSFTRAADMLNITQPTLSGQVKELEQRYGTRLFERRGRRVELTEIGQSAYRVARRMFQHEQEIEHLLQSAHALRSGNLRVGADSPYLATPLLAQFQRLHPGVRISIQYGNSRQLMAWLRARRCDVAFLPNIAADDQRLHSIPLDPDRLVAFVNREHDWAERRALTLGELLRRRIVLRERGSRTRSIFEEAVAAAGLALTDVMEIGGREGVREAVAAGFGVGIVAENELHADARLRALAVSDAELTHTSCVACLEPNRALRVTDAFLELVRGSR